MGIVVTIIELSKSGQKYTIENQPFMDIMKAVVPALSPVSLVGLLLMGGNCPLSVRVNYPCFCARINSNRVLRPLPDLPFPRKRRYSSEKIPAPGRDFLFTLLLFPVSG